MALIYMVRHGETQYNVEKRVQGWSDSPLTEKGKEQAQQAGQLLKEIRFDRAYAGDLGRQQDTARMILQENRYGQGMPLLTDPCFREIGFGEFESGSESVLLQAVAELRHCEYMEFPQLIQSLSGMEVAEFVFKADTSGTSEVPREAVDRFINGLRNIAAEADVHIKEAKILVVTSGAIIARALEVLGLQGVHIVGNGVILKIQVENGEFRWGRGCG